MQGITEPTVTLALPDLPRSDWQAHPHFPHQALLLGSHDNFRSISKYLVNESMKHWSASPASQPKQQQLDLFRRWKAAMKNHERYEERKLYPYLRALFGVSTAELERNHEELGRADKQVHAAFREGDSLRASHALKQHDEILVPHLAREEDLVIPLLLSMTPQKFRHYSNGNIVTLLRDVARDQRVQKRSDNG